MTDPVGDNSQAAARLIFRESATHWDASLCRMDSEEDAIPLGSILLSTVMDDTDMRDCFIDLMRAAALAVASKAIGGGKVWCGEMTELPPDNLH